mmetsp:Transcript_42150/g.132764  ORF Transcript_42150/g.132764 Transcript_42150/m.132764 type:complete len:747 (-) Transcript_42150:855-3095(-)
MIRNTFFFLVFSIELGISSYDGVLTRQIDGHVVPLSQPAAFQWLNVKILNINRDRQAVPELSMSPARRLLHVADICRAPSHSVTSRLCLHAKRRRRGRGSSSGPQGPQDPELFLFENLTRSDQPSPKVMPVCPPSVPSEPSLSKRLVEEFEEDPKALEAFRLHPAASTGGNKEGRDVEASQEAPRSNITEKIDRFREASRARQAAILSARKARWAELNRRMNSSDSSSVPYSDDLKYYESVPEAVLVRFAKWTKTVPAVDALFRPIDALLDVIENSLKDQPDQVATGKNKTVNLRSKFQRYRSNMPKPPVQSTPQPVEQGKRYPVSLTSGSLRTKDGTVYSMPEDRSGSIKKERKEIKLREVVRAWYGHPRYLWETVLEDDDGMWLTVGTDVTQEVRACVKQGILSLSIPFSESLGDPCADVDKVLCIDIVDLSGINRNLIWSDSQEKVKFFRAIQTTHSIKRLANIVTGDLSIKDAIEETIPMVASLRSNVFKNVSGSLADGSTSYELEARLGKWLPGTSGSPGRFRNGVTREFMDRVLGMCEGWDDWTEHGEWKEIHDYILKVGSNQYRVAVAFNEDTQQATKMVLQKKILKIKDFAYISTIGDGQPLTALSSDVRIALSEERILKGDPAIIRNGTQIRVRIKQRKSFLYTPSNAAKPVWRFDFTLVWSGKTLGQARNQQMNTEPDFELECECIDPYNYLKNQTDDRVVAEGLLLKLRDFLGSLCLVAFPRMTIVGRSLGGIPS